MLLWSSIDWRFNVVGFMLISGRVIQQRKLLTSSLKLVMYLIIWPFWSIRLSLNIRPSLHITGYINFSFSAINLQWNMKNQHWTYLYKKGNLVIRIKSVKLVLVVFTLQFVYMFVCDIKCVYVHVYTYIYVWVQINKLLIPAFSDGGIRWKAENHDLNTPFHCGLWWASLHKLDMTVVKKSATSYHAATSILCHIIQI